MLTSGGRVTKLWLSAAGVLCWLQLLSVPHVGGSPFPSPSKHVIREITRDSSTREKKFRRSVTSSSSQNSSLVNHDPKNRNLLRKASTHRDLAGAFQECNAADGQKGVFGSELIGCVGIPDLVGASFGGVNAAIADGGTSKENKRITESVLEPVSAFLTTVLGLGLDAAGVSFDVCLGDFSAEDIVVEDIALCSDLPLKEETEWSVIAVNIDLPPALAGTICPGATDDINIGVCIALSKCDDLPSVAVSLSGGTIGCLATTTGPATVGVGSLVGSAIDAGLESIAVGFSLTNAFEISIFFYNGFGLYEYGVATTYFDAVTIGINTDRLGLPEFIEISATITRGLAITAPPNSQEALESAFANFNTSEAEGDEAGEIGDILTVLTDFNVQALVKGSLEGSLLLSSIPDVGILFPDFKVDLGEMNALISIGKEPLEFDIEGGGKQLAYPGLSVFAGTTGVAAFIKGLIEFVVTLVGGLLDLVPSWIPIDIDAADIADKLDFKDIGSSDVFGAGFTANTERTGFLFTMPLFAAEFGTIKINCYTDYEKFNFETEYQGPDLGEIISAAFSAAAEEVGEATVWLVRETGEAFEEGGRLIAFAAETALDELNTAFSRENLSKTAKQFEDGFGDAAKQLEIIGVVALNTLILDPLDELVPFVEDTVKDIAKWGSGLADEAEDAFNTALNFVADAAGVLEDTFDCIGNAIVNGDKCEAFDFIEAELIKFGNDVEAVLKDIEKGLSDFIGALGDAFYEESYQYRLIVPEELDSMYKCPQQTIIKVTEIKFFGAVVDTDEDPVGKRADPNCIKLRILASSNVKGLREEAELMRGNFLQVQSENRDALAGSSFSVDPNTFDCSTRWVRSDQTFLPRFPLEVTCQTSVILADGTVSTEVFSVTKRGLVDPNDGATVPGIIQELIKVTKNALADKITGTMTKEPVDCVPEAGLPGDGVDNNCNGVADDNKFCHYEDQVDTSGKYNKDCQCTPPFIRPAEAVTLSCSADRSVTAVARPPIVYSGFDGCPTTGTFAAIADEPQLGSNPFENCGNGVLIRTYLFADAFAQRSNTVTTKITLEAAPPVLDRSLVPAVRKLPCTDEVSDGFLAPDDVVPVELGSSRCASRISEGYEDLAPIDYVGCPENMEDVDNNKFKGWNVNRRWFVEDECGQQDEYFQNVVREDDVPPVFDTFPSVRVQSYRASFEPINTGFPVVSDDCDPADVMNPEDWNMPMDTGRISFMDSGDLDGGERDFVRTFTAKDRVCNEVSRTQTIQTCPFEFQETASSTTHYDASSLLPVFKFVNAGNAKKQSFNDRIFFTDENMETVEAVNCKVGTVEYLDVTQTDAVWTAIPEDISDGVFKYQSGNEANSNANKKNKNKNKNKNAANKNSSEFSIQIDDDKIPSFKGPVDASDGLGVFRLNLSCRAEGDSGQRELNGCSFLTMEIAYLIA